MNDFAIKVEHLSKCYRIGLREQVHDTIYGAALSWLRSPFSNFRQLRNLSKFDNEDEEDILWALKDISFDVKQGEVVGIIGRNGAGKSTLLKVISRITPPTSGKVRFQGRVSSLLEVGTGFHPELTGRENIYLNGTILGMSKKEIDSKFDEIVEYSGVEKFIDTPVKRYSSGMKVRLAFAVAAHLEPEILLIDEVLAVGDAEFQKKCLGKMQDVTKEGRTILFVSHNMAAIHYLTARSILIKGGEIVFDGETSECLNRYLKQPDGNIQKCIITKDSEFNINSLRYAKDMVNDGFNKPLYFHAIFTLEKRYKDINFGIGIYNSIGVRLVTSRMRVDNLEKGRRELLIEIKDHHLPPGNYNISFGIGITGSQLFYSENLLDFDLSDSGIDNQLLIPSLKNQRDRIGAFIEASYRLL